MQAANEVVLFLDFDGTLVPLGRRPEQVWLKAAVRRTLARLARHPRVTVCLISGRRLADLRRRAKVPRAHYLGLHGWERREGARLPPASLGLLRRMKRSLSNCLEELPGVWIEDKKLSLTVHCRGAAPNGRRRAGILLRRFLRPLDSSIRILQGKKSWEVLPRDIKGKGAAVRALLGEFRVPKLPIYLGDDMSDEAAFAALGGGINVRVGAGRPTRARYRLRNPREVGYFLKRLEDKLR